MFDSDIESLVQFYIISCTVFLKVSILEKVNQNVVWSVMLFYLPMHVVFKIVASIIKFLSCKSDVVVVSLF